MRVFERAKFFKILICKTFDIAANTCESAREAKLCQDSHEPDSQSTVGRASAYGKFKYGDQHEVDWVEDAPFVDLNFIQQLSCHDYHVIQVHPVVVAQCIAVTMRPQIGLHDCVDKPQLLLVLERRE